MIYIGCHLSVTGGYEAMGKTMSRFGGNTFAWFTRNPRGGRTKKDRHEKPGRGALGLEAMKRIALHPVLEGLPFILETPNDDEGYIEEIHTVQRWFLPTKQASSY